MVVGLPRALRLRWNDDHCVRNPFSLNFSVFCADQSRQMLKPRSPQSSRSMARPMFTQMLCAWPNFWVSEASSVGIWPSAERKRASSLKFQGGDFGIGLFLRARRRRARHRHRIEIEVWLRPKLGGNGCHHVADWRQFHAAANLIAR